MQAIAWSPQLFDAIKVFKNHQTNICNNQQLSQLTIAEKEKLRQAIVNEDKAASAMWY